MLARGQMKNPAVLPKGDDQLTTTSKLFIFGACDNFRPIGPWHHVEPEYMNTLVDRLAAATPLPCSRGHTDGIWCSEDQRFHQHQDRPSTHPLTSQRSRGHHDQEGNNRAPSLPSLHNRGQRSAGNERRSPRESGKAPSGQRRCCQKEPEDEHQHSRPLSSQQMDQLVCRLTKPTVASRGGVDIREKFENKDYVYGSGTVQSPQLDTIVNRITRPTTASTGGKGVPPKNYGYVHGSQKVSSNELGDIVERMTRPTVSSRGGVDLAEKKFEYIPHRVTKTNPRYPGLNQRFTAQKKVSPDRMEEIVNRLNCLTKAYKAKYSPNRNGWVDESKRGPAQRSQAAAA